MSASEIEGKLRTVLGRRFPNDPGRVETFMGMYGADKTKGIIEDANLRAAFIALAGIYAEPEIDYVLNQVTYPRKYVFGDHPLGAGIIQDPTFDPSKNDSPRESALTWRYNNNTFVIVDRGYQYADFVHLSAFVAHETLHFQISPGGFGHAFIYLCQTLERMRLYLEYPDLAKANDTETAYVHERVMALLNSGEPGSSVISVATTNGANIFPGGQQHKDFLDYIAPYDHDGFETSQEDRPMSILGRSVVTRITGTPDSALPVSLNRRAAIDLINAKIPSLFSPDDLLRIADLLELDVPR